VLLIHILLLYIAVSIHSFTMFHHVSPCFTMFHHVSPCFTIMVKHVSPGKQLTHPWEAINPPLGCLECSPCSPCLPDLYLTYVQFQAFRASKVLSRSVNLTCSTLRPCSKLQPGEKQRLAFENLCLSSSLIIVHPL